MKKLPILFIAICFIGLFVAVVLVNAQEVYKQQSGTTKVTLVIHPAKKDKKQKDSTQISAVRPSLFEQFVNWFKK